MKTSKDINSSIKILFIPVLLAGVTALFFACGKAEEYPIEPDRLVFRPCSDEK